MLDRVEAPFYKWFTGGKINIVHNAIDRHANGPNRDKVAIIWEIRAGRDARPTPTPSWRPRSTASPTCSRHRASSSGDRVTIYLSRVPELVIAMLAVAKIGAMHSVVYGGFSTEALHSRIEDAQSKVLITGDGGWMNGKIVELKKITDEAVDRAAGHRRSA